MVIVSGGKTRNLLAYCTCNSRRNSASLLSNPVFLDSRASVWLRTAEAPVSGEAKAEAAGKRTP